MKGWKKELAEEDLYASLKEYSSKRLGDKLEEYWTHEELFSKDPSLMRALAKQFGPELCIYGILYFPCELCFA